MPSTDELLKEANLNMQKLYVLFTGLETKEDRLEAVHALAALKTAVTQLAQVPAAPEPKPAAQPETPDPLKVLAENAQQIMDVVSSFIRLK